MIMIRTKVDEIIWWIRTKVDEIVWWYLIECNPLNELTIHKFERWTWASTNILSWKIICEEMIGSIEIRIAIDTIVIIHND